MNRTLHVELGSRRYPITIGAGLLTNPGMLAGLAPGKHALVITDENVAPHWLAPLESALAGKNVRVLVLPPGEQEKNLQRFGEVIEALANLGASRDATVFALGGGVVGDLAGFAAACWMRGVRFVQLPTTLLAMVDSSVGGKTAVDLPSGKNLVGAFHQPAAVLADIDTLATLPERELRAGLAEVIKYGAIFDVGFISWLERNIDAILARDPVALTEAIARSVRHKSGVVARDEQEQGERMLLNFGHTFGHAIEVEQGYGGLLHGEAVAVGMVVAAKLSTQVKRTPAADTERLVTLLHRAGLPVTVPEGLDPEALLARMKLDKKTVSGVPRLILWRGIGRAEIARDVPEAAILQALAT
ncbi:MAG: 3-dehydroquinate synthase [Arenimonas sp.]